MIYELLRINNDEYDYITTACNFNLALEFEQASPKLCLQFLDAAIKIEEKSKKKTFLPHLYHMKGRWYFDHKNYYLAKLYFEKALKSFSKKDTLYIASMYNNFALCDMNMGKLDSSIKQSEYAAEILDREANPNDENVFFRYVLTGNIGTCYFRKKDYKNAEKFLTEELNFYRKNDKYVVNIVRNAGELFSLYQITSQKDKEKQLADILITVIPKMKDLNYKIKACEFLQAYYDRNDDLKNVRFYSFKLLDLNKSFRIETVKDLDDISDILNGYIIKNINQEYDYKIADQRKKSALMIVLSSIIIVFFIRAIFRIRKRNKEERYLLESQNTLLENNKEDLEKDIELQKGKIKNLHLNLNLKIETEKAFLENLKKMKKSKNINAEEAVKDLFFKINNLLQIDQKNNEFVGESSEETKQFMQNISERFPFLTEPELKLCVYFRLNLSSKEVSLLENITPGSVRVYKTRIKYKIGLNKETDLNFFLNSIK
ncbi:transcriptional regulator [Chryseobacterium limigenitum]|uniref:transcriptional regulator n=1 Tax=Chryseobacterium limigenitum TaxID=1612149 RepID=UPI001114FB17|nr:tetratricopeptide repeat protein [Chryseobacterium limigenitum]